MKTNFLTLIKTRRSRYAINNEIPVREYEIENIIKNAVLNYPSPFNSQSARIVLLLNDKHLKLWEIVKTMLKRLMPDVPYKSAEKKIDSSFACGYGTILFFEDSHTIKMLEETYPIYREHFKKWSDESMGMIEFIIWTYLANIGIGASLQHYNPLIDNEVRKEFDIPHKWNLVSQMPFGGIVSEEEEKGSIKIDNAVRVLK